MRFMSLEVRKDSNEIEVTEDGIDFATFVVLQIVG